MSWRLIYIHTIYCLFKACNRGLNLKSSQAALNKVVAAHQVVLQHQQQQVSGEVDVKLKAAWWLRELHLTIITPPSDYSKD